METSRLLFHQCVCLHHLPKTYEKKPRNDRDVYIVLPFLNTDHMFFYSGPLYLHYCLNLLFLAENISESVVITNLDNDALTHDCYKGEK